MDAFKKAPKLSFELPKLANPTEGGEKTPIEENKFQKIFDDLDEQISEQAKDVKGQKNKPVKGVSMMLDQQHIL